MFNFQYTLYKVTKLMIKAMLQLVIENCLLVLIGVDKIKGLLCEQVSPDT